MINLYRAPRKTMLDPSDGNFDAESSSVISSNDGIIQKRTKWQKMQNNLEGISL